MNVVYAGSKAKVGLEIKGQGSSFNNVGTYAEALFRVASGRADLVLVDSGSAVGGTDTQMIRQIHDLPAKYAIFRTVEDSDVSESSAEVDLVKNNLGMANGRTTLDDIVENANREN